VRSEDFFELRYLVQQASRDMSVSASACDGKQKFASKSFADSTLRRKGVKSYHCKVCRFWHVGGVETSREQRLLVRRRKEALCE
jgi:uncharacterized protein YlaI